MPDQTPQHPLFEVYQTSDKTFAYRMPLKLAFSTRTISAENDGFFSREEAEKCAERDRKEWVEGGPDTKHQEILIYETYGKLLEQAVEHPRFWDILTGLVHKRPNTLHVAKKLAQLTDNEPLLKYGHAIQTLIAASKIDSGAGAFARDFLRAARNKHAIDLSEIARLDTANTAAAVTLLEGLGSHCGELLEMLDTMLEVEGMLT